MDISTTQVGVNAVVAPQVGVNVLAPPPVGSNVGPDVQQIRDGRALVAKRMRKAKEKRDAAARLERLMNVDEGSFVVVHSAYPSEDGDIGGIDVCKVTENLEQKGSYEVLDFLSRAKSTEPKALTLTWVKPRPIKGHMSVIDKASVLATFEELVNKKIPIAVQRYFISRAWLVLVSRSRVACLVPRSRSRVRSHTCRHFRSRFHCRLHPRSRSRSHSLVPVSLVACLVLVLAPVLVSRSRSRSDIRSRYSHVVCLVSGPVLISVLILDLILVLVLTLVFVLIFIIVFIP
jgi:hypothetical protein